MAIAKGFDVGDTVWVNYPFPNTLQFTPQSRVVKTVEIISATANQATVRFTNGNAVTDSDTTVTVYTTQALAAAALATAVIAATAATVALDATTSIVSTAGNSSTTLGRIG